MLISIIKGNFSIALISDEKYDNFIDEHNNSDLQRSERYSINSEF